MFTGIDEVDWASLRHAYGSAEEVPGWLRALASADAAERETALDGLYGAVHHQGKVYDSTLACVPFLFSLAAREAVPERGGIVELLVRIGADSAGGDPRARSAVCANAESFVALAEDPDPGVRRAAADAVVRFLDEPGQVLELLRRRFRAERDERVLLALTDALGLFGRRNQGHADAAADLLTAQSAPPYAPAPRLAALGQLALTAPGRLPADLVPAAVRLLRDRSAQRARVPDPSDPADPDTLVGRLRRLRPSDEEGAHLLRTLHTALGDRTGDRIALLTGQLTSPDPVDRCNAVWMSAGLFREWRADYTGPVTLIGAQVKADQDRLRDAAVSVLAQLYALAAPAADDLYALVAARPELWTHRWERACPTLGGPLKALARTGDPRAVPVLAQLLAGPVAPDGLGFELTHLGRAAVPLAPALRLRLGRIPLASSAAELAPPLLSAVRAVEDTEAVPEVLRLLPGSGGRPVAWDSLVPDVIRTLEALGAAGCARPLLRDLLNTRHAALAAGALWSADGDTTAVLPVLLRELRRAGPAARRLAARRLSRLGSAARPAVPELRRVTRSGRPAGERVTAAYALWCVDGDPGPVLPVFRTAWSENPHTRAPIARCLLAMGSAAAPLRDLVAAELATPRRHTVRGSGCAGQDIPKDEALLKRCREVMAQG
ncbi:HEAT repeat domain-containing protein [Streptomyces sp. NK08204]|uniref:HEAT repeat domain-containing protein n=1 Tax=Streptomyces sp. NK08204 TaxID=2873260 RepID=UPI001CECEC62|nr:HEAT repeat domain-containing protein [Streptomyces sp. NK08204]